MNGKKGSAAQALAGILLTATAMAIGGMVYWNYMFRMPCRMEADCRGKRVEAGTMKRWEEREEDGYLGIINMAGWRVDEQQIVCSVSTGRKAAAKVVSVHGSMELVEKADILFGRYGLDADGDYCVLCSGLASHLFGSTQVAGECVKVGQERFIVAGVIEKEEDMVMIPMIEGPVDHLAVFFENRVGAEEKLERLMSE